MEIMIRRNSIKYRNPNMLDIGQMVHVYRGSFKDFEGKIKELSDMPNKIWISSNIFGRPIRIEANISDIKPITKISEKYLR